MPGSPLTVTTRPCPALTSSQQSRISLHLFVAPDERRQRTPPDDVVAPHFATAADNAERVDRRLDAADAEPLLLLQRELIAKQPPRPVGDEERVRRRVLLQPGGDVDGIADGENRAFGFADDHHPGVDRRAAVEGLVEPGDAAAQARGALRHRSLQGQRRRHRARRIVLVRPWIPEQHEDAVAEELQDAAAVAFDDRSRAVMEGTDDLVGTPRRRAPPPGGRNRRDRRTGPRRTGVLRRRLRARRHPLVWARHSARRYQRAIEVGVLADDALRHRGPLFRWCPIVVGSRGEDGPSLYRVVRGATPPRIRVAEPALAAAIPTGHRP